LYESYLQENRKNINFYFRMAGHGQLFGRYLATKLYFSCLERHWNDYEQRKHKLTNDEIHEINQKIHLINDILDDENFDCAFFFMTFEQLITLIGHAEIKMSS
jgi:hypothetical protein